MAGEHDPSQEAEDSDWEAVAKEGKDEGGARGGKAGGGGGRKG